jgi:hypothetical protein
MTIARALLEPLDEYGNVAGGRDNVGEVLSRVQHLGEQLSDHGPRVFGLYQPGEHYRRHDLVHLNGSEWRAMVDDPGPLPGPDWALSAKVGSRGRPGPRGLSVAALDLVDFTLVLKLSDGSELRADLRPAFERFEAEQEAAR